ncbi:hypothetical protein F8568_045490 [Actinomadura sp. LD22]|uniref:Uncharacterized protein n=1 Tax=Actinomadura physcomitrii TaxID=2650748 RepID=A0A6I4MMQ1_9ACTN|nr:hypothetical protein [Actinomadura physcomitrii]MWA07458.1 hypothetical protein [Actinomadura physcomitrii]
MIIGSAVHSTLLGHGGPRAKNGLALAGHGVEAVRDTIAASFTAWPEHLRRSLI